MCGGLESDTLNYKSDLPVTNLCYAEPVRTTLKKSSIIDNIRVKSLIILSGLFAKDSLGLSTYLKCIMKL